jgi:hypothetical protein
LADQGRADAGGDAGARRGVDGASSGSADHDQAMGCTTTTPGWGWTAALLSWSALRRQRRAAKLSGDRLPQAGSTASPRSAVRS